MNLFVRERLTLHAGQKSSFKIECDALADKDIATLAYLISRRYEFSRIIGVPRGGLRLAEALEQYQAKKDSPVLIVDDVLTTGTSMEAARAKIDEDSRGIVIFARGLCPEWVEPIFQMWDTWE